MRLKSVKDTPLLSPPQSDGWMAITDEDRRIMCDGLAEARKENKWLTIARMHKHLRGIGIPQEITANDITAIKEARRMEWGRSSGDSEDNISELSSLMVELGVEKTVPEDALKLMHKRLGLSSTKARELYLLMKAGRPIKATEEDCRMMRESLSMMDREKDTVWKGEKFSDIRRRATIEQTYQMSALGIRQEGTPEVKQMIKEMVAKARKVRSGMGLAFYHYLAHQLLTPAEHQETPMPQVKRFGGVK